MNQSRNRQSPRRQPDEQRQPNEIEHVERLWSGYLQGGYFDTDGNLRVEYVSRERVEPLIRAMANARPALTTGQIRRFFQHCRRVEARLKAGEATWPEVRPQVLFLDAAAQDAHGKAQKKIPALFFDFIRQNVAAIGSADDFRHGFIPHFEALVGFGSAHIRREGN